MQFIDLAAQQQRIRQNIEHRIQAVLDHGKYIMGPEVAELENALANYVGCKHAISCASGTDALLMALMSQQVGQGDIIFTTPFTFIATAEVISLLGAVPAFVDIDPHTFNIDPGHLKKAIEATQRNDSSLYPIPLANSSRDLTPRGIIAVDLFGLPADYQSINAIADQHDLFVIEDAAQSFGATAQGKRACDLAGLACTSFFPAKPLGAYGDGGMCFTSDDQLADIMRSLRVHGKGGHKYDNVRIGLNGRLDTLQAAILLAKFDVFPEEVEFRQKAAERYFEMLGSTPREIRLPEVPSGYQSVWAQYSLLARDQDHRSALQATLKDHEIPTAIYYPKPLHLQSAFSSLDYNNGDFPVSENSADRIFSIPMHPYLEEDDQKRIVETLLKQD